MEMLCQLSYVGKYVDSIAKEYTKASMKRHWHTTRAYVAERKTSPFFWVQIVYLAAVLYLTLFYREFWTPDLLFLLLLILFILLGRGKKFFLNFAPFILLLLTYDSLRGLADNLDKRVHYTTMINFDRFWGGGQIPTITLQRWLWHGYLQWYDFYFYALYTAHFVFPVLLAVYIWLRKPNQYLRYIASLVALSYAGFITYIIFPAAPPWMASQNGFIPHIEKISTDVWFAAGIHNASEVYAKLNPNPVAAVPSLHAAYPTLFVLFVWRLFGPRRAAWFMIYPISVWFGVIYMGEHYLFDVTVGILYAIITYVAINWLFDRYGMAMRTRWERFLGRLPFHKKRELRV